MIIQISTDPAFSPQDRNFSIADSDRLKRAARQALRIRMSVGAAIVTITGLGAISTLVFLVTRLLR